MKKKATKGAKKAKVRDLPTRKRAAGVRGGATTSAVQTKQSLQLDSCWVQSPGNSALRG